MGLGGRRNGGQQIIDLGFLKGVEMPHEEGRHIFGRNKHGHYHERTSDSTVLNPVIVPKGIVGKKKKLIRDIFGSLRADIACLLEWIIMMTIPFSTWEKLAPCVCGCF